MREEKGFVRVESGDWINKDSIKQFYVVKQKFKTVEFIKIYCVLKDELNLVVKSEFKTEEEAQDYLDSFFCEK